MRAVISLLLLAGTGIAAAQTLPTLSIKAAFNSTMESQPNGAVFTISITEAQMQEVVVPLTVAETGNVLAGTPPTSVTIPANSSNARLTIALDNDERREENSVITVTIGNPDTAAYAVSTNSAMLTVTDDDGVPTVSIEDAPPATEGTPLRFPVRLSFETERTVTVIYGTSVMSTATEGDDFIGVPNATLTFQPGETAKIAEVPTLTDDDDDAGETVVVRLIGSEGSRIEGSAEELTATGIIVELPVLSIVADETDGTVTEAEAAVFTISIALAQMSALAAPLTVTETGNVLAGAAPTSVTLPANSSSVKLTIALDNDERDEEGSVITVAIGNPDDTMYVLGMSSAMLTVTDDDDAPRISVAAAEAREGDPLMFRVSLSVASELTVSVSYVISDGTATAGEDYEVASGMLTFQPNETQKIVAVATMRDDIRDPDEKLHLVLSAPDNATLDQAATTAEGTIVEGLDEDDVRVLNEAILPYVASAVGKATSQAVSDRAKAALGGNQAKGLSVRGASFSQFLVSQASRGSDPALFGRGGFNRGQASLEQWQTQADGRSSAAQGIPRLGIGDLDFTMALSGQGSDGAAGGDLNLWGRGFYTDLSSDEGAVSFDGSVTGGMIGIDLLRSGWLLGLLLNRAQADVDWDYNDFTGSHETTLTGLHPYFARQWDEGVRIWGSLGYETGETEITDDDNPVMCDACKFDVTMTSMALGISIPFYESAAAGGELKVSFIGDSAYSRIKGKTQEAVTATSSYLRAGVELDYQRALANDSIFGSGVEATWRNDSGDVPSGHGLELGGSLDLSMTAKGLHFDLDVRALLTHRDDIDEWSLSGGVSWAPKQGGKGLSFTFKPQWGALGSARDALWEQGLTHDFSPRQGEDAGGRYSLELRYGLPVLQGQELLSLFARNQFKADGQRMSLGADFNLGQHFSSGYELLMRSAATAAERASAAEHRGFIRYQRSF